MTQYDTEQPTIRVGFVIDNVIVDILSTDERLASIFMSQPQIIDLTTDDPESFLSMVSVGWTYDPEKETVFPPKSENSNDIAQNDTEPVE
jgi:hypothetical protein